MNNIYDVLEICLNELEHGADIETVLLRYPDLADELRPILETSANARAMSAPEPNEQVVRRNRAKILQHAAELRERNTQPRLRFSWALPLRRLASTFAILAVVFASGTSLVGAASTSLPGDNLYGVKRSWENLQLVLTFNAKTREALEVDHENERIDELLKLFAGNRSAEVEFNGLVTRQGDTQWTIAGVRVVIVPETSLPSGAVVLNSAVKVEGVTQGDGSVLATKIEILSLDDPLPDVEEKSGEDSSQGNENESDSESGKDAPIAVPTQTPAAEKVEFNGVLNVTNGEFWMINGVPSDVSTAEVEGIPALGAAVTVEGYFNPDGTFIVTKIKFEEKKPDGASSGSNSNSNNNSNSNDNGDDNDNDNDNDNNNDNNGSGGGDD